VGERVGRIAPLDADHVGAEIGQVRAQRARIGEIDTRIHDRGPAGIWRT
jgi:hypothetical protein